MLFDYEIEQFRNIEPTDYITKTTKYNVPNKSENYLQEILYIFPRKNYNIIKTFEGLL